MVLTFPLTPISVGLRPTTVRRMSRFQISVKFPREFRKSRVFTGGNDTKAMGPAGGLGGKGKGELPDRGYIEGGIGPRWASRSMAFSTFSPSARSISCCIFSGLKVSPCPSA
jgi:hypothetical protein